MASAMEFDGAHADDDGIALPESWAQDRAAQLQASADAHQASVPVPVKAVEPVLTMLCPDCGSLMPVNAAGMCVNCIRARVDITEGIPKQGVIYFCRGCERYLSPPNTYILAALESRELLALCLKRLKGLSKVKMIDAGFIWTEPHSKRIKVKLTVQKEVMGNCILQQVFVVEYTIHNQMCDDCHRREAKDTWCCVVQLRQKVKHKKTFFYVEQLIIKHRAQRECTNIIARPDGVDFFFATRSHGKRLIDFLTTMVPTRTKTSERLISADIHTSTYNFKHSFATELVPICRGDVVCLHPEVARKSGHMSPIVLVQNVASVIHLLDPSTLQIAEITSVVFWRHQFASICSYGGMKEFMVLDIEPVRENGQQVTANKYLLAEATVARISDLGLNDIQFVVRTHLGYILQAGDMVWGFDLDSAVVNDPNVNKLNRKSLPDVILVKKSYSERRRTRRPRRNWKLASIVTAEAENMTKKEKENAAMDYEGFLQDLEEDRDLRANVNIYQDPAKAGAAESEAGDDELRVDLDEMLAEFDGMDMGVNDDALAGQVVAGGVVHEDAREETDPSPKRSRTGGRQ